MASHHTPAPWYLDGEFVYSQRNREALKAAKAENRNSGDANIPLAKVITDYAGEARANLHLIVAAPELFAVIGDPEGYHDPLGFLSALVIDLKERLEGSKVFRTEWEGDDPTAAWECLSEVEALIARGRAALTKARAEQMAEADGGSIF